MKAENWSVPVLETPQSYKNNTCKLFAPSATLTTRVTKYMPMTNPLTTIRARRILAKAKTTIIRTKIVQKKDKSYYM